MQPPIGRTARSIFILPRLRIALSRTCQNASVSAAINWSAAIEPLAFNPSVSAAISRTIQSSSPSARVIDSAAGLTCENAKRARGGTPHRGVGIRSRSGQRRDGFFQLEKPYHADGLDPHGGIGIAQ